MPSADTFPRNPRTVSPSAPSGSGYWDVLRGVAAGAGLDVVGVAPVAPMLRARAALEDRIARDMVNGMRFTFLRPQRSTSPADLVEGARSVIVAMLPYAHDDTAHADAAHDGATWHGSPSTSPLAPGRPLAEVARYAGRDHVGELKSALGSIAARLRRDGHRATIFADDNAIVDREAAWLAGLGWFGKNANILVPGRGSWFVIGCIVTTADLPVARPAEDGCDTCTRCVPACPTGAIAEPGVIDARRCLSWLLQKPGIFAREHRVALGARIYGCDDCQTACPVNRRHADDTRPGREGSRVDVLDLLTLDDAALDDAVDRWWVEAREMAWVRRNLLIVLGNIGDPRDDAVRAAVEGHLDHPRPEVRAHALWAAARLGFDDAVTAVRDSGDGSPEVVDELAHLPPLRPDL